MQKKELFLDVHILVKQKTLGIGILRYYLLAKHSLVYRLMHEKCKNVELMQCRKNTFDETLKFTH